MKLGCSTVLFNQLDLYGALQHIAWAGYEGVDCSDIIPARHISRHIKLNSGKSYIDEVKSVAKKHRLELFSIDTEEEGETEEDKIKSLATVFDLAQKLSIPFVVPYLRGKSGDKEVTKRYFKYIRKLTEQAESRGITLAIKVHVGTPIDKNSTVIQMLDEIDSPALGITLDTRELCRARDNISEAISKIGKKIVHVHFRNYPLREEMPANASPTLTGFGHYEPWLPPSELQIPGRGGIDFPKILRKLNDVGYDKAVDLVITGAYTYPLSKQMGLAAESRGYLNRCLQELKQDRVKSSGSCEITLD